MSDLPPNLGDLRNSAGLTLWRAAQAVEAELIDRGQGGTASQIYRWLAERWPTDETPAALAGAWMMNSER